MSIFLLPLCLSALLKKLLRLLTVILFTPNSSLLQELYEDVMGIILAWYCRDCGLSTSTELKEDQCFSLHTVTLATPHKKTCYHLPMGECERITAFLECQLVLMVGTKSRLRCTPLWFHFKHYRLSDELMGFLRPVLVDAGKLVKDNESTNNPNSY